MSRGGLGLFQGAFVSYVRVSAERQGPSGLGLPAQRRTLADFLASGSLRHVAEALSLCRLHRATLVIANLDRLSCDAAFFLNLQKAGVRSSERFSK